jgi:serine protease AprX
MSKIFKVYEADAKSLKSIPNVNILQKYPAFSLVETLDDAASQEIEKSGLTEDITASYTLPREETSGVSIIAGTTARRAGSSGARSGFQHTRKWHHYIVQFIGPVRRPWLTAVTHTGAKIVSPYEGFSVIARATAKQVAEIAALADVRKVEHLPYSSRLAPQAKQSGDDLERPAAKTPRTRLLPGAYDIQFFDSDRASAAKRDVSRLGFTIIEDAAKSGLLVVQRRDNAAEPLEQQLQALVRVHGVQQISRRSINRISNDRAAVVMGTATALKLPSLGLSGQGEVIAICDTGLDTGDAQDIHPDFTGRIKAIKSYPISPGFSKYVTNPSANDGASDVDSGHGTHTSGSILGDGTASSNLPGLAGPVRGLAYKAQLVMQAVEQEVKWKPQYLDADSPRYSLAGLPSDLASLFSWAYGQGARIHSNSWGGGDPQLYDSQCRQMDLFVWNKPDFCILFAAGNDGEDTNGNGTIDEGSVTPPGTAKNCITVGASCNNRPNIQHTNLELWGPKAVPVANLAAGDPANLAPFSSRGPTRDGRIKPDVVAPGTYVLSTRSRRVSPKTWGYGRYGTASLYMFDSGTSMATPLVAGAVGVVREFLRTKAGLPSPSAALLKATLIASAVPINGITSPPDNHQGFGRVNIDAIIAPSAPIKSKFVEGPKLATGDVSEQAIQVTTAGKELSITLVYSDYPGETLINNLNLVVRGPDGSIRVGNAPAGSNQFDQTNNVERIIVPNAAKGAWRVQVIASNVPSGPQPFALAIQGAM